MRERHADSVFSHGLLGGSGRSAVPSFVIAIIILVSNPSPGAPPNSARRVPPIDPELLTESQKDEWKAGKAKKEQAGEEIRNEIVRIEAEIKKATNNRQPTTQLEADLKLLKERGQALHKPAPWDPTGMAWPAFQGKTDEIKQITDAEKQLSVEDADRLIGMLYTNVDPKLNRNLQILTLNRIGICSERNQLSDEVRLFLRNSVLDYYNATRDQCDDSNKGAMCSPHSMVFLARAIAVVTTSEDAEAQDAFNHLKMAAIEKCSALQWEREKSLFTAMFAEAEVEFTLKDEDIHRVTGEIDPGLAEEDIAKSLRVYRRVLHGSPRRVKPEVVATIDRNMLRLAQLELSRKNWELWADVAITLGSQRASPAMIEYVSLHNDRKDEPKSKGMAKVWRVYSRLARKQ